MINSITKNTRSLFTYSKKPIIFSLFKSTTNIQRRYPSFDRLRDSHIKDATGLDPELSYKSRLFWSPRFYIQNTLSPEFLHEITKFRKTRYWTKKDILSLTQLILIEATRDTTFDLTYNFQAQISQRCLFYGEFDILLYQKHVESEKPSLADRLPFVPVLFSLEEYSSRTDTCRDIFSIPHAVGAGTWCLENGSAVDPSIEYVRVLQTDGHRWRLYEVHRKYIKKTQIFSPFNGAKIAQFHEDEQHMKSVIGLIRFGLGIPENIVMGTEEYKVDDPSVLAKSAKLTSERIVKEITPEKNLLEDKNQAKTTEK